MGININWFATGNGPMSLSDGSRKQATGKNRVVSNRLESFKDVSESMLEYPLHDASHNKSLAVITPDSESVPIPPGPAKTVCRAWALMKR